MERPSPEFESMVELTLALAHRRTLDEALETFLDRLDLRPHLCGGGLWTVAPRGEEPSEGEGRPLRLHGMSLDCDSALQAWTAAEGDPRNLPLASVPIGLAASRGEVVRAGAGGEAELPAWAREAGVPAIVGAPLLDGGDVLGVLVFFFQRDVDARARREGRRWVRILADHFAAAVRNERSVQEIQRLRLQLEAENEYLREEVNRVLQPGIIIGDSVAMARVLEQVRLVAKTDAAVLVQGESGTGKEVVARAIHEASDRAHRPLIRVNCAAVPRELFESEFFGHLRGAFTGAVRDREGRFELADGGTLFLDEVGEIPVDLQAKLLRVLQEGTFERVGEERTRRVDVRVIAATNADLAAAVEEGRFRRDLFFRLSVFPVEVPPLRKRREDIPALANHFLDLAAARMGRLRPPLKQSQIMQLQRYGWPGNVRELQNVLERALILSGGGELNLAGLKESGGYGEGAMRAPASTAPATPAAEAPAAEGAGRPAAAPPAEEVLSEDQVQAFVRENLARALRACHGKVGGEDGAAVLLGVPATTLRSRIKRYGLEGELHQPVRVQEDKRAG